MKKRTKPAVDCIPPTAERIRHADGEVYEVPTDRAGVTAYHVRVGDALDGYFARRQLDPRPDRNAVLYDAGCRLREAWHSSGLEASGCASYQSSVQTSRDADYRMVRGLDAAKAYRTMMQVIGVDASDPVATVCCMGQAAGEGHRMRRLREGLHRLAVWLDLVRGQW